MKQKEIFEIEDHLKKVELNCHKLDEMAVGSNSDLARETATLQRVSMQIIKRFITVNKKGE